MPGVTLEKTSRSKARTGSGSPRMPCHCATTPANLMSKSHVRVTRRARRLGQPPTLLVDPTREPESKGVVDHAGTVSPDVLFREAPQPRVHVCTSAGKPFVCHVIVQKPEGSVEVTGLHEVIHSCLRRTLSSRTTTPPSRAVSSLELDPRPSIGPAEAL